MNEATRYASLRDYLRVLRSQWWVIAAITLVAGAAAFAHSSRQQELYEASASMSFTTELQELSVIGLGAAGDVTPPIETPPARAQSLDRPEIVRAVRDRLAEPAPSFTAIRNAVGFAPDDNSPLIRVSGTWSDPEFAAEIANHFSRIGARQINAESRDEFKRAMDAIERRIDNLGDSNADAVERGELILQLTRLRFLQQNATPARVVEEAEPPSSPVSPQPLRNTVIGLLLGMTLGVLTAFLRDSLDRRLRDSGEIQKELSFPVIGHVRNELMGRVVRAEADGGKSSSDDLEGFRIIRRNLDFLAVDSPTKLILVTSALPEEGKSTVAGSLAWASAASGAATLLLECDLRRPSLSARMGLEPKPGLTDHLAAHQSFEEVSHILPPADGSPVATERGAEGPPPAGERGIAESLVVVTAGTPSPQPAELLHSDRMRGLLDALGVHFKTVVIDSSPLLPVADTLELLPLVDCVVLCVRAGQTTRDQARAATAALGRFPDRPTGLVVTGLRKRDASGYGYYSYSYSPRGIPTGA